MSVATTALLHPQLDVEERLDPAHEQIVRDTLPVVGEHIEEIAAMDYAERHAALCEALISVFTSADFAVDGLTGPGMTWQTNGEVAKEIMVMTVENGAYVAQ